MKCSWESKLECVGKYKSGERSPTPGKTKNQRNDFLRMVGIWAKAYDGLGVDGLMHSPTNKCWTAEERFDLVAMALTDNSIRPVAEYIDYYNNRRIRAKTKWMPPSKFREASMSVL